MDLGISARVLVRPFRTYASIRDATLDESPTLVGGALRLLFVIGAFVAFTATGRLAPFELVVAMGSYAYVPIAQFVALSIAVRAVTRKVPLRRAFALYLVGHGPWFLMLLGIAAACLLAPAPATVLFAVLPKAIPLTFLWSGILTFACMKRGLGFSGGRAAVCLLIYLVSLPLLVLGYFVAMGQLVPLFRH